MNLELLRHLGVLPDQERVLGRDHPDILRTRNNIALAGRGGRWRERCGCHRVAAGPGAGAGPRPPRHAHDPQQHRRLDRRGGGRAERCGCTLCCRTGSGCWAATTPTRSTRNNIAPGPARWGMRVRRCGCAGAAAGPGAGAGPRPPRHADDPQQHRALDRRGGERAEALRLYTELLADQEHLLCCD